MSSSLTGRLARRASNGACLLRPSLYQLPTPPSRLRRHAVITVRLQRTAKPPPPPTRRCWLLHAYATPRAPTRARALPTPPCGSTLYLPSRGISRPPAPIPGDQGFRPPVCAAPSLPTLAWARCHVVPLAVCSTSSYSYLRGGAVVVDSARRRGGNRRKSESQVGIHPSKCFRRRLATSSCSACRTFAVYSSSAVLRAVLVSRVAFRRRSLSNSRRQWRFRVCFVPQRCRPTGPTHGRSVSLG